MSTILIERGEKAVSCWRYLRDNNVKFISGRHYPVEGGEVVSLFFNIEDSAVASYCAIRFS